MKAFLFILSLIFQAVPPAWGQDLQQYVLKQNIVDSLFVFDYSRKNDHNETRLKYLGQLQATDGRVFKVMTYTWIWGISHRATNRILIFNAKNEYVGNYYVTMISDLPDLIRNNELIFRNGDDKDCDPEIIRRINFTKGLPKRIFIECKKEQGNFYTFSNE